MPRKKKAETAQVEVETQEAPPAAAPPQEDPKDPKVYVPDKTPIESGPLAGLPKWMLELRTMFLGYGQQIQLLTQVKQEMEAAFGDIVQALICYLPEEVRADESPIECVIRCVKQYAEMKDQHEPMAARLAAAEKELELLKKG